MDVASIAVTGAVLAPGAAGADEGLRAAAEAFEAAFLAEMLQHTGLNTMPAAFGGGAGEEAFAGLLTEQYARLLAEGGGIGLAEQIFTVLKKRADAP
jgi:flagellar protein FlgJ